MTYTVGKVFGIEIKLHALLVLLFALGSYGWYPKYGVQGCLFGALLVALMLLCVLLHEFGHSLVAQHFGIPVKSIMLWPLGGLALLTKKPPSPRTGLLISAAGPAVNVVIGLIFLVIDMFVLTKADLLTLKGELTPSVTTLLLVLCLNNFFLAIFNLLPAWPMDGGMILLHTLALKMNVTKAMKITANISRGTAVIFGTFAAYNFWITAAIIAGFVFFQSPTRPVYREDIYG